MKLAKTDCAIIFSKGNKVELALPKEKDLDKTAEDYMILALTLVRLLTKEDNEKFMRFIEKEMDVIFKDVEIKEEPKEKKKPCSTKKAK